MAALLISFLTRRATCWAISCICCLTLVALAGYRLPAPRDVRVAGRVAVNGKLLQNGVVIFHPDPAKGNTSRQEPRGEVNQDGSYDVSSTGRAEIAPGWYKVSVVAVINLPSRRGLHPPPRSLIDKKYSHPDTSGLSVEVAKDSAPGAYDLKLKGPRGP